MNIIAIQGRHINKQLRRVQQNSSSKDVQKGRTVQSRKLEEKDSSKCKGGQTNKNSVELNLNQSFAKTAGIGLLSSKEFLNHYLELSGLEDESRDFKAVNEHENNRDTNLPATQVALRVIRHNPETEIEGWPSSDLPVRQTLAQLQTFSKELRR